jgi:hypothetical protein
VHDLDAVDASRASETASELKQSPLYIPKDDNSLIPRIGALFGVIHDNPLAAIPLAIIAFVLVSFDVMLLMALKGVSMPSEYCTIEAGNVLSAMVRGAELTAARTRKPPSPPLAPVGDDPDGSPPAPRGGAAAVRPMPAQEPLMVIAPRGRGRPRKQLNGTDEGMNHG